ncbi:zinc-binding alcohol dehydrogenase family protein [Oceanobacillus sojae]|uniref:zinc-binding alcohol dehydrogenase family protein n=1 Tax=Oceanobacillus sojae TaxID=582851 RepID=UPI0021A2BA1F|nr:zinc-binding alcohol dehydrogenase family protein [Oceanobacillus sojae]MCT1905489.1 zinc-binding alcohol dehydrogenase family protein [Oceanobacillus sojae]
MNQTMKAIGLYRYLPIDHEESLLDLEVEKPKPTGRDILVQVKAIAVNPVDYKVRSPKDKVEENPRILGWDVSGIVEAVGEDCKLFQPGDEVYYAGDLTRPGGNSAFHLVDERIAGKKPNSLDFAEAASLPLTSITAYEALFERLAISQDKEVNKGKSILIIGAGGGVGSIAVQLAKIAGLTVIGTASRPETAEWTKEKGADFIINHYEDFVLQLENLGINNVNYILCLHSTEKHWENMAESIAAQGKICSIVETDEALNLTLIKNKSVTFAWETMFTKSMYQTKDMISQHHLLNHVAELVDNNVIHATVNKQLSPINAENLKTAHAWLETGQAIGKVVLKDF